MQKCWIYDGETGEIFAECFLDLERLPMARRYLSRQLLPALGLDLLEIGPNLAPSLGLPPVPRYEGDDPPCAVAPLWCCTSTLAWVSYALATHKNVENYARRRQAADVQKAESETASAPKKNLELRTLLDGSLLLKTDATSGGVRSDLHNRLNNGDLYG